MHFKEKALFCVGNVALIESAKVGLNSVVNGYANQYWAEALPSAILVPVCTLCAYELTKKKKPSVMLAGMIGGFVLGAGLGTTGEAVVKSYDATHSKQAKVEFLNQTAEEIVAANPKTMTYHQALATLTPQ